MAVADTSRGDWQCPNVECYNHTAFPQGFVYGSSVNCKKCGTGRAAQRPGDWCCPNVKCINHANFVYANKLVCPKCNMPKPHVMGAGSVPTMGGKGNGNGNGKGMGMMGGMGMQAPMKTSVAPAREGDWHCANPDCKNFQDNIIYGSKSHCPLCGLDKPAEPITPDVSGYNDKYQSAAAKPARNNWSSSPYQHAPQFANQPPPPPGNPYMGMATGKGVRPGDWNCTNPDCKNHTDNVVYGSKTHCPLCLTPKPENAGKQAPQAVMPLQHAGPSSTGMRPGDWHCPNQGCKNHRANVIYASKQSCPLCHTPRPSVPVRNVTGRSRSPHGM